METYAFLKIDDHPAIGHGPKKKVVLRSVKLQGGKQDVGQTRILGQALYTGLIAETEYSILSDNAVSFYKNHGVKTIRRKVAILPGEKPQVYDVVPVVVRIYGADKPHDHTPAFVVKFYCSSEALKKLGCDHATSGFQLTVGLSDLSRAFKVDNSSSTKLKLTTS